MIEFKTYKSVDTQPDIEAYQIQDNLTCGWAPAVGEVLANFFNQGKFIPGGFKFIATSFPKVGGYVVKHEDGKQVYVLKEEFERMYIVTPQEP